PPPLPASALPPPSAPACPTLPLHDALPIATTITAIASGHISSRKARDRGTARHSRAYERFVVSVMCSACAVGAGSGILPPHRFYGGYPPDRLRAGSADPGPYGTDPGPRNRGAGRYCTPAHPSHAPRSRSADDQISRDR